MKVVFLDIDGVLNHHQWLENLSPVLEMSNDQWWVEMIDPSLVVHLNSLLHQTGAKVVVSSTWRRHFNPEGMQRILTQVGFKGEVIDCTTKDTMECRGLQISKWVQEHPEVTSFVILDDRSDMAHLGHLLVRTSEDEGLGPDHVIKACEILKT